MLNDGRKKWKSFFKKENMIVIFLLGILLLVIAVPTEKKRHGFRTGVSFIGQQ